MCDNDAQMARFRDYARWMHIKCTASAHQSHCLARLSGHATEGRACCPSTSAWAAWSKSGYTQSDSHPRPYDDHQVAHPIGCPTREFGQSMLALYEGRRQIATSVPIDRRLMAHHITWLRGYNFSYKITTKRLSSDTVASQRGTTVNFQRPISTGTCHILRPNAAANHAPPYDHD